MEYEIFEYKGKWLYDIFLDELCVGNQGDGEFESKEEAEKDANEYIVEILVNEYNRNVDDFKIEYYQALK